ncbi:MAG: hypothetical protein IT290_05835 [Deltaproteobacteria bacterium]|nr:hypothetical protein [Deltaproteobacteria bacterium]
MLRVNSIGAELGMSILEVIVSVAILSMTLVGSSRFDDWTRRLMRSAETRRLLRENIEMLPHYRRALELSTELSARTATLNLGVDEGSASFRVECTGTRQGNDCRLVFDDPNLERALEERRYRGRTEHEERAISIPRGGWT